MFQTESFFLGSATERTRLGAKLVRRGPTNSPCGFVSVSGNAEELQEHLRKKRRPQPRLQGKDKDPNTSGHLRAEEKEGALVTKGRKQDRRVLS